MRNVTSYLNRYLSIYRGFERSIWLLALITFVHRAGTMVLPFLTQYLHRDLAFSKSEIGQLLLYYGLGAIAGALIGGRLTDRWGYRKVLLGSLLGSGIVFASIPTFTTYDALARAFFTLTLFAEAFRPALFVAVTRATAVEKRTRALTLVRLAINLGVSIGPALAGVLVVQWGYGLLFYADALACLLAVLLVFSLRIQPKTAASTKVERLRATPSEIREAFGFLTPFLFTVFCTSWLFFQLYHTLPLYHTEVVQLSPAITGYLMALNGVVIVLFELPLVAYFDRLGMPKIKLITAGTALFALAFAFLLLGPSLSVLIGMMLLITFGVMLCSPFSNALVLEKAPAGYTGLCAGAYTMCIGLGGVVSSTVSFDSVERWGYTVHFSWMAIIGVIAFTVLLLLQLRRTNK